MINSINVLGIIPARGGSKGVPRKNIKLLSGKPLIAYTIETAIKSKYIDKLTVSTDDKEIADISKKYGIEVPFLRPSDLASDTAKAIGVVQHVLLKMEKICKKEFPIIVYLEPPAPLKVTKDIDNAIEMFNNQSPDSVVSVNEASQFHPMLMKKIVNGKLQSFCIDEPEGLPRQLYKPKAYLRNGGSLCDQKEKCTTRKFLRR